MKIEPYSEDALAESLHNGFTSVDAIRNKNHFKYLSRYLSEGLGAATIVIEEQYVSKDYLHDYASYYSLCFQDYSKFCKRIHFFRSSFTLPELEDRLLDTVGGAASLNDDYLGFIVIKPIPVTIIGYTVLKTYPNGNDSGERKFWGVRQYNVHFYGVVLTLESLAFQEQDSILAACATTAIWSMLNKAAADFHTILKSPSEITKDADKVSHDGSRLFPNKGLNIHQICQSIQNSGLVSEIKQPNFTATLPSGQTIYCIKNTDLKKILNAYSAIGIPIILVVYVPYRDIDTGEDKYGLHALTVSGFKKMNPEEVEPATKIRYLSEKMDKFYAHDDQWGPFARIEFGQEQHYLTTPWTEEHPDKFPTYLTNIIVPVYPKIRISYLEIEAIVLGLDIMFNIAFGGALINQDLVWDIRIDYSENHKKAIRESGLERAEIIRKISKPLPKYVWVTSCYTGQHKILEFVFDATDVRHGKLCRSVISYLPDDANASLREYLTNNREVFYGILPKADETFCEFIISEI